MGEAVPLCSLHPHSVHLPHQPHSICVSLGPLEGQSASVQSFRANQKPWAGPMFFGLHGSFELKRSDCVPQPCAHETQSYCQAEGLLQPVLSWDSALSPESTPLPAQPPSQVGVLATALSRGAGQSAWNKFSNQSGMCQS